MKHNSLNLHFALFSEKDGFNISWPGICWKWFWKLGNRKQTFSIKGEQLFTNHSLRFLFIYLKVGGRPAWLDLKHLPSSQMMTCPQCEKPRVFLLQVYAPDNNQTRAFHRTIYIFICKNEKCWNSESPPILVLRWFDDGN